MARKNGKAIGGKLLNFIGLVDDGDPADTYGDEYESGSYGQRQAYQPQRQQSRPDRSYQEMTTRRTTYEPTARSPRMNRNADRRSTGYESRYESARSVRGGSASRRSTGYSEREDARPEHPARYDYSPRGGSSRFGSYSNAPASRFDAPASRFDDSAPQPRARQGRPASAAQKTVMCNLYSLGDCKSVIDQLIQNYTVIITLNDLETAYIQRAVDTLSGAVFALNAKIRRISENTYLIAPNGMQVDDFMDGGQDY